MRSATSYFNGTLYRKTLARFWPLWVGYGVIWLFFIPLNMLNRYFDRYIDSHAGRVERLFHQAVDLPEFATPGLFFAAFFAILCAMAVFGYLYSSRSACWFHALPMRREALFSTQYLAGLSFMVLPQLAVAVLTAMIELAFLPMGDWGRVLSALLVWLLAQSGVTLFFFSFAAFCAMFTGHILALPAFYCILNVLASVIYELLDGLFREFFFGYAGSPDVQDVIEYLTPGLALKDALIIYGGYEDGYYYRSSGTVAVYAAVGVALSFASLYVYRRRHVETAGDVVAVPLVRPLFKYGVAFCSGLCFGMFTAAFFNWNSMSALIPCVLVWTAVGCFVAEMLLKKSFRVLKHWKGAAVMTAVMLLLCVACQMDLLGVAAKVPSVGQVDQLDVLLDLGEPDDNGHRLNAVFTDPEDIQKFIALHQAVVDDRARLDYNSRQYRSGDDTTFFHLRYRLKGGSSLDRDYSSIELYRDELDQEGSVTQILRSLMDDRELVAQAYNFEGFLDGSRLVGAWLYRLDDEDGEQVYNEVYVDEYAKELWAAVQQDFAEGNIGMRCSFNMEQERQSGFYRTELNFTAQPIVTYTSDGPATEGYSEVVYGPSGTRAYTHSMGIALAPTARHTLAVLEKTGIYEDGYSLSEYEPDYGPRYRQ